MNFSAILGQLSEALKSIDFQAIIQAVSEMAKQLMEMLKPLLGSLTAGTTDPSTTANA